MARDDKLARLVEEVQALREDMQTALDTFEARSIAARTTLAAEQMALGALIEEVATRCLPVVEFEAAPYVTARQISQFWLGLLVNLVRHLLQEWLNVCLGRASFLTTSRIATPSSVQLLVWC